MRCSSISLPKGILLLIPLLNSEVSFLNIVGLTLLVFGNFQLEKNKLSGGAGIGNIEYVFAYCIVY